MWAQRIVYIFALPLLPLGSHACKSRLPVDATPPVVSSPSDVEAPVIEPVEDDTSPNILDELSDQGAREREALARLRLQAPERRCPTEPHSIELPAQTPGRSTTTLTLALTWIPQGDRTATRDDPLAQQTCVRLGRDPWQVLDPDAEIEIAADDLVAQRWVISGQPMLVFAPSSRGIVITDSFSGRASVGEARSNTTNQANRTRCPDDRGCPTGFQVVASFRCQNEVARACRRYATLQFVERNQVPPHHTGTPTESFTELQQRVEGAEIVANRQPGEAFYISTEASQYVRLWSRVDGHLALAAKPGEQWLMQLDPSGAMVASVR